MNEHLPGLTPQFEVSLKLPPPEGIGPPEDQHEPRVDIVFEELPDEVLQALSVYVNREMVKGTIDDIVERLRLGIRERLLYYVEMGQLQRSLFPLSWEWKG